MTRHQVAVWRGSASYPTASPFAPSATFPEFGAMPTDATNEVYSGVRQLFMYLGFDREQMGTATWNPLGWLVRPGDCVFIKPNLIAERNQARDEWKSVVTHGAVVRAALDYIALALRGKGRIIIGDAPQTDSRIDEILEHLGLRELQNHCRYQWGIELEFVDLRDEFWPTTGGVAHAPVKLGGDPRGSAQFDLGTNSYFSEVDHLERKYYGAHYDIEGTNRHHEGGRHEYKLARTPLEADVFVNIPKLKTHKKVGLTLNLKSLVGINADKNYLPHYAIGAPGTGGDQFPDQRAMSRLENLVVLPAKRLLKTGNPLAVAIAARLKSALYRVFGRGDTTVRAGNWWGNDTCWRMSLDLNRALLYGSTDGVLTSTRKRYFSIVDGIIGMEGNGPTAGEPRDCGILMAGTNPAAVDAVAARLIGFSPQKLAIIRRAFDKHEFPICEDGLDSVDVVTADGSVTLDALPTTIPPFAPHFAWKGHVEH